MLLPYGAWLPAYLAEVSPGKVDGYKLSEFRYCLMTYFGFLLRFLILPLFILLVIAIVDVRRGRVLPERLRKWVPWAAIILHVFIALIYTTPWDNYLVATGVWWYDPELVTGITLGWVPIEEYTFFILQPIMVGLWWLLLARRMRQPASPGQLNGRLRFWIPAVLLIFWFSAVIALVTGFQPGTYLALELGWAIPPIALQFAFGADILWRYRKLVAAALVPPTLYLAAADALAIGYGTWTIDPQQSLHWLIGGVLPIEEFVFFTITNVLVTFGITLVLAEESHKRFGEIRTAMTTLLSRDDQAFSAPD